jgi:hypothetical protein
VLQTEGESNALKFSQVFHLMPVNSSFVVTNGEQRLDPGAYGWCISDLQRRRQLVCCWVLHEIGRLCLLVSQVQVRLSYYAGSVSQSSNGVTC